MPEESDHTSLSEKLRQLICQEGPLAGDLYMRACLSDPQFGYYMGGDPFGKAGDFITAPEISQTFGELLGAWTAHYASLGKQTEAVHFVEIGPGRGVLMADALRAVRKQHSFTRNLHVHLVDISPARQQQQQQCLERYHQIPASLTWYATLKALADKLQELPTGPVFIIANELLDALPIQQWRVTDQGWQMRHVDYQNDSFIWCWGKTQPGCPALLAHRCEYPHDPTRIYEISPEIGQLIHDVSGILHTCSGAALWIDYGYTTSQAGDSLQAVKAHQFHDPLEMPGKADITAHVDFASVARQATACNLKSYKPISQGQFLQSMGIGVRLSQLVAQHPDQASQLMQAGQRLYHPQAMGTLFKVICLTSPDMVTPPGW